MHLYILYFFMFLFINCIFILYFFFISVADSMIFSWDGNQRYVNMYVNISIYIYILRKWNVNLVCKFFFKNDISMNDHKTKEKSSNFLLIL